MNPSSPSFLEPDKAGRILERAITAPKTPRTIADAALESGLALRDAETGLHWLTHEYRGHLRVAAGGDLLFVFPHGFEKPWQTRDALSRGARAAFRVLAGAMRFLVRAWVAIALIGYALLFLAIIIGLATQRSSNNDSRGSSSFEQHGGRLLRAVVDALYWTFHPFSPVSIAYNGVGYGARGVATPRRDRGADVPFYEKVNRFVFGPTVPAPDPRQTIARLLEEIRAQKGRVGLSDVMRVTGLPREEADPLMARLMLDYNGDVVVSDEGGITYRFPDLRRSAETAKPLVRPASAWATSVAVPALTGNSFAANAAIFLLNGFNLVMATSAMDLGLTLRNLRFLAHHVPPEQWPQDGTPLVLGVIPLVFSLALVALPLGRAIVRPHRVRQAATTHARLALLEHILARAKTPRGLADVAETDLSRVWTEASGREPKPGELTRVLVSYGADVNLDATKDDGVVRYRFPDLEAETSALEGERRAANDAEVRVGEVVFASDNEGGDEQEDDGSRDHASRERAARTRGA